MRYGGGGVAKAVVICFFGGGGGGSRVLGCPDKNPRTLNRPEPLNLNPRGDLGTTVSRPKG